MSNSEKSMCDYVLEKGEIIDHYLETCEGVQIEQYVVLLFGERYVVTKNNGEWVYFFH